MENKRYFSQGSDGSGGRSEMESCIKQESEQTMLNVHTLNGTKQTLFSILLLDSVHMPQRITTAVQAQ